MNRLQERSAISGASASARLQMAPPGAAAGQLMDNRRHRAHAIDPNGSAAHRGQGLNPPMQPRPHIARCARSKPSDGEADMRIGIKRALDRMPGGMMIVAASAAALRVVARLGGGNGTAGIAAATSGSNAAAPALAAAANPPCAPAAPATALVAACVIVGSLSVPLLTAWWARRMRPAGQPLPATG